MTAIDDISPCPWDRHDWTGDFVSVDGTDAGDFGRADVSEVIAWGDTGDRWDGNTAGIIQLEDGRFVAWEASYGPTGNGFCRDAYGGTSDLLFGATVEAVRDRLSIAARELLEAA